MSYNPPSIGGSTASRHEIRRGDHRKRIRRTRLRPPAGKGRQAGTRAGTPAAGRRLHPKLSAQGTCPRHRSALCRRTGRRPEPAQDLHPSGTDEAPLATTRCRRFRPDHHRRRDLRLCRGLRPLRGHAGSPFPQGAQGTAAIRDDVARVGQRQLRLRRRLSHLRPQRL